MGFGKAFLSLCLLASVQAAQVIPVSQYEVKTLVGETADGSVVAIPDFDWDGDLEHTRNWFAAAWIQIHPSTANTARFLQFKGFVDTAEVECYATWASDAPPTFTFGSTDHVVSGYTTHRQENVWFRLIIGSENGDSFGYITFRAATNYQYSVIWTESVGMKRKSTFIAPVNASPFNVSSK
jgi:hypothetical protein